MIHFTIKDLAELSGVKQHTIRIWEHRFSFLKPKRAANCQRTYTIEELNTLLDVALLNQNGYKISKIDKLEIEEKIKIVSSMFQQQQTAINGLIINMARMHAEGFERVLDSSQLSWGIHETVQQVLFPFCDKIGLLDKIHVRKFQENILVIREVIKQKLHLAIEKATRPAVTNKLVLLFLNVNEANELPLLYLQYLLKMAGYKTLNLGQNVPLEKLQLIYRQVRPDFIITYPGKRQNYSELTTFIASLNKPVDKTIFICVENNLKIDETVNGHYKYLAQFADVVEFMNTEVN